MGNFILSAVDQNIKINLNNTQKYEMAYHDSWLVKHEEEAALDAHKPIIHAWLVVRWCWVASDRADNQDDCYLFILSVKIII